MKKQTKLTANRLCILTGICLLVAAAVAFILWQCNIDASQQKAASYVDTIRTLIPKPQGAVLEERRDNTMSVLSVEGTNFVGLLEIPKYGSVLPVCADWGATFKYPCCLSGSVYDRTIQIGGTTQKGQYDFYREMFVGDLVFFTDMEGNRFSYQVTDICYEDHADQTALQREDAALTLFIKNIFAFEYVIIFCDVQQ